MDVGAWLRGLGLERYEAAFRDNAIDADVLPDLTEADLEKLGVLLGHRKRLLRAIAELGEPTAEGEAATPMPPVREPAAERRQLTVLFCDLVGSTELAARLDPEDLREVISVYHGRVAGVVGRYAGHVAKYMGDGVLAYFGYPKAHEDAAERAVRAGLDLVEAIGTLGPGQGATLRVRIGIASGLVVVGDLIGSGAARGEVVGETPNLAARLQALAKPGTVVIGPNTRRLIGGLFECADLGARELKGLAEPVRVWRVLGPGRAESRFEARQRAAAGATPLVGRETELALLLERWNLANEGEGQVVLLSGEPGIGKSRLVQALREPLDGGPHTRLSYHCSPHRVTSPLHPVIEQLERAAGFRRDDTAEAKLAKLEALLAEATHDIAAVAPLIADLLSLPTGERYPPLDLTPQRRKERLLDALLAQLEGLAAERPVLNVFEDAHWLDPTTAELLGLAVERVRGLRVLLVVTARPEFTPRWAHHAHATLLTLNRLSRRQGAALVERVTGGKGLPPEMLDQIVAKTDGVPLFVEELTKTVLESGLLQELDDRYVLAGPLSPLAIPATLHDSLMARLDRLTSVKEVAQIGAVIGREFSHELLAGVAPVGEVRLREALERLVEAELVFRRGTPPKAIYTFKHALVRDAAYESLLRSARRVIHARILEQLAAAGGAPPELLAQHAEGAERFEEAVANWRRAGDRAATAYANREALTHFRHALRLIEAEPASPERDRKELAIRLAIGAPLIAVEGAPTKAVERNYARADAVARALGEHEAGFTARRALWSCHHNRGELARSLELAEGLLAEAETSGDVDELALACRAVGAARCFIGDLRAGIEVLRRGAALPHGRSAEAVLRTYGEDPRVVCSQHLGMSLTLMGQIPTGLGLLEAAIRGAERLRHPYSVAFAKAVCAHVRAYACGPEAVRALAEEIAALSAEHGLVYWSAHARMTLGWAIAVGERRDEGVDVLRDGFARWRRTGAQLVLPAWHHFAAEALAAVGRTDEALDELERALAVADRTGERWLNAEILRLKGDLLLIRGERDEGQRYLRRGLREAGERGMRLFELRAATSLARLWRDQGKRAEARNLLARAYGGFTEGFDTPGLQDAKALLDQLR